MAEWVNVVKSAKTGKFPKIVVNGESMGKIIVATPDTEGRLGKAIADNLVRLATNIKSIFGKPKLTLNDPTVPDDAGGMLGIGTGDFEQGKPHIQLPPSRSGKISYKSDMSVIKITMGLNEAATFLHEVNHAIHRFVNSGKYLHPKSSELVGAVSQDIRKGIMSRNLQTNFNYSKGMVEKKANEMETYWLSCCDAVKYNMDAAAVRAIKAENNKNLVAAHYEYLGNEHQADVLREHMDDDNLWANMYDINELDPTRLKPPKDDVFNNLDAKPTDEPQKQL